MFENKSCLNLQETRALVFPGIKHTRLIHKIVSYTKAKTLQNGKIYKSVNYAKV